VITDRCRVLSGDMPSDHMTSANISNKSMTSEYTTDINSRITQYGNDTDTGNRYEQRKTFSFENNISKDFKLFININQKVNRIIKQASK